MKTAFRILAAIAALLPCALAQAADWSAQDYELYSGDFNGDGASDVLYIAKDPLHQQKVIAAWAGVGGAVIALSLVFGGRILKAGRRRRWRSGALSTSD